MEIPNLHQYQSIYEQFDLPVMKDSPALPKSSIDNISIALGFFMGFITCYAWVQYRKNKNN